MVRQVRIELPGVLYHVMARTNRLDLTFISRAGQDQELLGVKDTAVNRSGLVARLDVRMVAENAQPCGLVQIDDQTLNRSLRRGCY